MAERCGLTMLLMFTASNYKVMEQKHAACVERYLYDIYTEIPCLEMSGSNDMAILNQVCFQTLFIHRRRKVNITVTQQKRLFMRLVRSKTSYSQPQSPLHVHI